jgi:putative membrane protein
MKQVLVCALAVFLTPWLFGQTSGSADQNSMGSNDNKSMSSSTSDHAMSSDQKFVMKAAQGGKAEVEMGQLALQKASDDKVKQFAQKMVDDHTKANDQLKQVAQAQNIPLPTSMDAMSQKEYDRLSKMSGTEFDKAYMQHQLKDHRKDVAEFQKEASSGKNADIKNFASSTLPVLQEHLKLAEQITPKETRASK